MPWNGSGTYTRGYPSWGNDANNGLPISSTKFDLEDNDFAAGIQNCLTIDGQNKPNAALTWNLNSGQILGLTRGSDGSVFSAARTNGTNNPALQVQVTDAAGVSLSVTTSQSLFLNTGGVTRATLSGTTAFGVTGVAGSNAVNVTSPNSAGNSFGIASLAGTNSSDYSLVAANTGGGSVFFKVRGDGVVQGNDGAGTLIELGYKDAPLNTQGSNYAAVVSDRGKAINASASITVTIPSATFPAGAVVIVTVGSGATVTIAQGGGMTLQWAGNGATTGNRTLTGAGVATLIFLTSSVALISGAGLT